MRSNGKNKKYFDLVLIVFITLLIIGSLGFLFYNKLSDSKNRFRVLIENVFGYLEENTLQDRPKVMTGNLVLGIDGKGNRDIDQKILDHFKKVNLSFDYGIDYVDQRLNFEMRSSYDKMELLNSSFYVEDGNGYLFLDKLFDKSIKVPVDDYHFLLERSSFNHYRTIYNSFEKALILSLNDDYFEKDYVTIETKKILKTTLKMNQKNYFEMKENIFRYLTSDRSFLKSMSNILNEDTVVVKKRLKEWMQYFDDNFKEFNVILYTKNDRFVKLEVEFNQRKIVFQNEEKNKYFYAYYKNEKLLYDGGIQILQQKSNVEQRTILINDKLKNLSIQLNFNSSSVVNQKVLKKNITNSVLYKDVSLEEWNRMYSHLLENKNVVQLLQDFNKINGYLEKVKKSL